jgi:hypothetical protein
MLSGKSWLAVRLSVEEDEMVMKGMSFELAGAFCALVSATDDGVLGLMTASETFEEEDSGCDPVLLWCWLD